MPSGECFDRELDKSILKLGEAANSPRCAHALTGISAEELASYRRPGEYESPQQPVAQPGYDPEKPHLEFPTEVYAQLLAMPDEMLTELMSEPDPPVRID